MIRRAFNRLLLRAIHYEELRALHPAAFISAKAAESINSCIAEYEKDLDSEAPTR